MKRVLVHYELQSEEEAVAEDEAALNRVCTCSSVAKRFVPTHPGEVLLEDVLKPLGLTLKEVRRK